MRLRIKLQSLPQVAHKLEIANDASLADLMAAVSSQVADLQSNSCISLDKKVNCMSPGPPAYMHALQHLSPCRTPWPQITPCCCQRSASATATFCGFWGLALRTTQAPQQPAPPLWNCPASGPLMPHQPILPAPWHQLQQLAHRRRLQEAQCTACLSLTQTWMSCKPWKTRWMSLCSPRYAACSSSNCGEWF